MSSNTSDELSQDERIKAREIWSKSDDNMKAEESVRDYLNTIGKDDQLEQCLKLYIAKSLPSKTLNKLKIHRYPDTLYGGYINRKPKNQREKLNEDVCNVFKRMHVRRSTINTQVQPEENHYGLVVGKVQSGKTAHMLGLAAIALDGLYERQNSEIKLENDYYQTQIVVVLSGLIDDLRIQTSNRLKKDFNIDVEKKVFFGPRGDEDLTLDTHFQKELKSILVRSRENSEFEKKIVIIIKKNYKILDKLTEIISESYDESDDEKLTGSWLIIDDECDYASQDKKYSSLEPGSKETTTNESLRRFIKMARNTSFGEAWYVGYTATPFSNILANPYATSTDIGPDLFPSGFISLIEPPKDHLDNSYYFNNAKGLEDHYICVDSYDDATCLKKFVMLHCLTHIIKKVRKLEIHHTSMVHLERLKLSHVQTLRDIRTIISGINIKEFRSSMKTLLKSDYSKLSPAELSSISDYIDNADDNLIATFFNIELIELNRRNKSLEEDGNPMDEDSQEFPEEIIYRDGNPRNLIITGGDRISRGLTLEGLTISLFKRTAKKPSYDTMLQMARWNGYRKGYDDLVRIMTTQNIADDFMKISIAEKDMRDQIRRMTDQSNPVLEIIQLYQFKGLKVTGSMPAKEFLRWYNVVNPYFISDKIYLTHPPELVNSTSAYEIVDDFLESIDMGSSFSEPPNDPKSVTYRVSRNNDQSEILVFFNEYLELYNSEKINSKKELQQLIQSMTDEITDYAWNIAFALTPTNIPKILLSMGEKIGMGLRTPKPDRGFDPVYTDYDTATEIDLEKNEQRLNALVLIYFVNPIKIPIFIDNKPVPLLMIVLPHSEGIGSSTGIRVGGHRPPSLALKSLLEEE